MASSLMVWGASNILTQGKLLPWKPDDEHKLTYSCAVQQGKGQLFFQITDTPEAQAPESLAGPAALAVLETFDIRAACMHLIYAAHVAKLERPWADEFIIDDTDIAYYLGLDKRTDWTRDEKLALIERLIWQPAQLLIYLYWPPQGKLGAFAIEKSKLWDIAVTYHGQINLFNRKGTGLTVRGRAGLWAQHFLNRQGQKDGHARLEYGFLTQRVLHTVMSCWQSHAGAARLMVWLLFKSRVGKGQPLTVETLLEVAYGQSIISTAQHDRHQRHTLATRWDGDLLILQDQGWHIQFDPITYPPDIQPDWKGRGSQARPIHWWARLQQARLSILPPPELETALAQLGKPTRPHPQKRTRVQVSPPTKEVIREARIGRGWRQADLAQAMGKSRQWVGMIENGERRVTPEELPRLCQILHLPPTGK